MSERTVYLVSVQGPEWNDPVAVYASKRKADARAKKVNKALQEECDNNAYSLSQFSNAVVVPLQLHE